MGERGWESGRERRCHRSGKCLCRSPSQALISLVRLWSVCRLFVAICIAASLWAVYCEAGNGERSHFWAAGLCVLLFCFESYIEIVVIIEQKSWSRNYCDLLYASCHLTREQTTAVNELWREMWGFWYKYILQRRNAYLNVLISYVWESYHVNALGWIRK